MGSISVLWREHAGAAARPRELSTTPHACGLGLHADALIERISATDLRMQ